MSRRLLAEWSGWADSTGCVWGASGVRLRVSAFASGTGESHDQSQSGNPRARRELTLEQKHFKLGIKTQRGVQIKVYGCETENQNQKQFPKTHALQPAVPGLGHIVFWLSRGSSNRVTP